MPSYIGRHAELYDIFYADKLYDREAAFVHECVQEFGIGSTKHMLELACGSGSHAIQLEKYGYQITASDYSLDMLERARDKAKLVHSNVDFKQMDMRSLPPTGEPKDVVICLFDSIGYVATNDALQKVFQGVHRQLRKDGLFIFEFWHAGAMLRSFDPVRIRRWNVDNGEILRISETKLDLSQQLAIVKYSVYELNRNGTYFSFSETQINRYFLVQEMAGWLSINNFCPIKWFSGFEKNESIDQDTWHVVAIARSQ
jgi:SAM-dependent methyltransferase